MGNNEFKGIFCKLKYLDICGIILPYNENIRVSSENREMFQLEVSTNKIDLGQNQAIIFYRNYNFCLIKLNYNPINFLLIDSLSEDLCQNHLLYFIEKDNVYKLFELTKINPTA